MLSLPVTFPQTTVCTAKEHSTAVSFTETSEQDAVIKSVLLGHAPQLCDIML